MSFFNNFIKKKFVSDSIITIGSHIFIGASGLIVNSIIGINYNAYGLGIFSQCVSIYFVLSILANFGIETSTQKHTAQFQNDNDKLKIIFVNSLFTTLIISIIVTITFYIFLFMKLTSFISVEIIKFLQILCISTPFFAINKTINSFNVGLRKMNIYSIVRSTRWLMIVIGILIIMLLKNPITTIPKIFIFTELCISPYLIIINRRYFGKIYTSEIKLHLTYGTKNMIGNFSNEFNLRMPIVIVGYILGNIEAGFFAYVLSFARAIVLIPQAIQKNFNPVFTKNWFDNKHKKNERNIMRVFKHCLISLIPAFLILYVFFIIYTSLLMPPEYLSLYPILLILLFGMATIYLFGPFMTFLVMTDYLYINILRIVIPCILNILVILLFIKEYGNMGVALAGTISLIYHLFLMNYLYKRFLNIDLFNLTIFSMNK